jgi:hypothetical protein
MLTRDKEKQQQLHFQARQLAKTGRYRNWEEIESALSRAGREGGAGKALRAPLMRFVLNVRWALARPRADTI